MNIISMLHSVFVGRTYN